MKENTLKIEYLPIESLEEYARNTRKHGDYDVEKIAQSIEQYGFNDPIGVWSDHNVIVEGHGRLAAAKLLGLERVPVIRLDHMTDEERRQYGIAHNRTAELSVWDFSMLEKEISELDFGSLDLSFDFSLDSDSGQYFDVDDTQDIEYQQDEDEIDEESKYTTNVNLPQYEPKGECPDLESLCDESKTKELMVEIINADIPDDIKHFLSLGAQRHLKFNYSKVADYYAHADAQVQRLMEASALVIIDLDDAIKYGYAEFAKKIEELRQKEV